MEPRPSRPNTYVYLQVQHVTQPSSRCEPFTVSLHAGHFDAIQWPLATRRCETTDSGTLPRPLLLPLLSLTK